MNNIFINKEGLLQISFCQFFFLFSFFTSRLLILQRMPSGIGILRDAIGRLSDTSFVTVRNKNVREYIRSHIHTPSQLTHLVCECVDILNAITACKPWKQRTRQRYENALYHMLYALVPTELMQHDDVVKCIAKWKPDTDAKCTPQSKVVTIANHVAVLPREVRRRHPTDALRQWFSWWIIRWAYVEHANNHSIKRVSRPSLQQTKKMACLVWQVVRHLAPPATIDSHLCSTCPSDVSACLLSMETVSTQPFVGDWLNRCSTESLLCAMYSAMPRATATLRKLHMWWLTVVFRFTTRIIAESLDMSKHPHLMMANVVKCEDDDDEEEKDGGPNSSKYQHTHRSSPKQIIVLTTDELTRVQTAPKSAFMNAIWTLSSSAALRIGDVVCIKRRDVVADDGTIRPVGVTMAKNNTPKPFALFPDTVRALEAWLKIVDHHHRGHDTQHHTTTTTTPQHIGPRFNKRQSRWLFPSAVATKTTLDDCVNSTPNICVVSGVVDRHVSTQYVQRAMQSIFKSVGVVRGDNNNLRPPSFHIIRHTVSQRLVDAGNSVEMVARFLGHKSCKTTVTHYLNRDYSGMIHKMHIPWVTVSTSQPQQPQLPLSRDTTPTTQQQQSARLLQLLDAAIVSKSGEERMQRCATEK